MRPGLAETGRAAWPCVLRIEGCHVHRGACRFAVHRPRESADERRGYRLRMKLLLVEDDAAMQTALKRALRNRGMEVELCGDGRLALERWKSAPPDVVLLDLTLPGMDGLH